MPKNDNQTPAIGIDKGLKVSRQHTYTPYVQFSQKERG